MDPRVIAVGAGKGGVGKSTVALNLARALRAYGAVGVLDLDFYGPNIPSMVGIEHEKWTTNWTLAGPSVRRFRPVFREDLAIVSTGFVLGEDQPFGVDSMTAGLIAKQLIHRVAWPELQYLVVDLPPGTSTVQQILVRELTCAGALVVVTPQLVAHLDARKAVQMFRSLKVRVLGAIENMSEGICPHCGQAIMIFPSTPHDRSIWSMSVEKLAQIPLEIVGPLSEASTIGHGSSVAPHYVQLADRVVTLLGTAQLRPLIKPRAGACWLPSDRDLCLPKRLLDVDTEFTRRRGLGKRKTKPSPDLAQTYETLPNGATVMRSKDFPPRPEVEMRAAAHALRARLAIRQVGETYRQMYPRVRLRKLRADGTAYVSWFCYRLPDRDGFVRLFVPSGTPRVHAMGSWTPDGVSIAAIHPERPYVVHWWRGETRGGFYVDAARSIQIHSRIVSYVDLVLDLASEGGEWKLLDEDELSVASEDDARRARGAIEEVRRLISAGSSLFDATGDMWSVPGDAMTLKPQQVRRLV